MADKILFKNVERTENLGRYLDEIRKFKVLTPDEEYDLVIKAKNGDESARDMLVNSNQRYIYSLCKKFSTSHNVLDLVNIANEGFIKGIERFDPTRGFKLYTYAQHYALQAVKLYLLGDHLTVKKSNYNKTYSKVNKIKNKFFVENGRMPQVEEIQEELMNVYGIDIKEVCDLIDVNINSINQSNDDGETFYEESAEFNMATSSFNQYEDECEQDYYKALVATMLKTLTDREQIVIKKLFGLGCYQQDMDSVAKEMNMSKERIRQIKNEVCYKLKTNSSSYDKRAI